MKTACNGRHECEVTPTNQFGDPCPNVYKYMEIHFECVSSNCFHPLLQSSGKNGQELSASSGTGPDALYTGIGWIADASDTSPWIQYDPVKMYKLWAVSTWGTGAGDDTGKWVEEYFIEYQSSHDETKWNPYTHNYETIMFVGNSDPFAERNSQLEYPLSYRKVRIRPTKWHPQEGPASMRVEFFGCEGDDVISCSENSENFILENTPDGTAVTKTCPAQCREAMGNNGGGAKVYGTGIYSGDSMICMAAIHAGVIQVKH